ncbi:FmdB family zinc ribbon protein [Sphaerobacter thermophilus]|jgi:putative FmdB family regulatory protein|uniref:Regulatory protein, FmdB family n=1 Tax=Sphaerobacter thermophilus (strain ATCC 49802 / DSM 20745 / KCCM 41009 / NCIMB 13125 / S 6022) TaxID=479434 RepID=D1C459_SPHTD|nr:FmdB family zinc ribbon protein [Sphaerobacter thermophilus]ACZ39026.1 regulatory protein, FmdB family [Sphaerobacter thermophilus DSM 20745]PZN67463.1 MAG: FmdB family transcriptional regulator [Sphaerobacter thermophilus]
MPIYEYACGTCGHTFERKQRFSDEPVSECPECGAQVRRVLHPAGIIFKGSGWYITDSRKSNGSSSTSDSESTSSAKETSAAAD